MTTCPKCGHAGPHDEQCSRCGIIFERMHTVLDHSPVGAMPQAALRANEVARTLGASPVDRMAAPSVDLRGLHTPAPTAPPVVPMVARTPRERRTWLLVVLLVVTGLLFLDQVQDRRQTRHRRTEAAALVRRPAVDEAYLNLALESMLDQARMDLRLIDDPQQATATLGELLTRVSDLEKRLDTADVARSGRGDYAEALASLRTFLQQDASAAIAAASVPGARPEPVSILSLEKAEAAFEVAKSAH